MADRTQPPHAILPRIVATGFTTAFLGDERTLREFVAGDSVVSAMRARGENAVLYLINDSYDPLNVRQLRVGVNKDPKLIARYEPFCGRPISEVPDPYDCHASYSDHFLHALMVRLETLGIHPAVIDSYRSYGLGHYQPYVAATFEHYVAIQEHIASGCDRYTLRDLFRVHCPKCGCIDATHITAAAPDAATFHCERCDLSTRQAVSELRGKLSWKLDCAARWNLFQIHTEVFSKQHLTATGTVHVARLVSERFYGGHVPSIVRYGDLRMSAQLSGRLLQILPPALLKRLLTDHLHGDLDLTAPFVKHFANSAEVRPGMSYAAYVRRVLPRAAIEEKRPPEETPAAGPFPAGPSEGELVAFGNRFSEFFYGRTHRLKWPAADAFQAEDPALLDVARGVIGHTLALRNGVEATGDAIKAGIRSHLASLPSAPGVYPLLRRVFGQEAGASITTLLSIMPREYLSTIHYILSCLTGKAKAQGDTDDDTHTENREAA